MIEGAEPSIARSQGLDVPVTGRIGVIVYVIVGDGDADLEILGPEVATLNGRRVPTLRVHNGGNAHGRMSGFLTGTDAKGISYDFTPVGLSRSCRTKSARFSSRPRPRRTITRRSPFPSP